MNDWSEDYRPTTLEEFFNMKHSSVRNVIERCLGIIKKTWTILKSPFFYPIMAQNKIIMACCLLHNFIRRKMHIDPSKGNDEDMITEDTILAMPNDPITSIGVMPEWTIFRTNHVQYSMFHEQP